MKKPKNIPNNAQLISGIGASSWFTIVKEGDVYRINRYSINGDLDCSRLFYAQPTTFNISKDFKFTYISHCQQCTILQDNIEYKFLTNEH